MAEEMIGNICVKFSEKTGRTRLDEIDFSGTVSKLRDKVSKAVDLPLSDLSLTYCGRLLCDMSTLKSYGLKPGCTVHALRKVKPPPICQAEPLDDVGVRHLITVLRTALLNPAHRQAVHKILTSTEAIDNVIAATPGLAEDHIAVSMLRDPELLIQIADTENVRRIVCAHPAVGHAVMHIAASVSEEGARNPRGPEADQALLLGEMSDDEMDTSADGSQTNQPSLITQVQLSAALAAAGMSGSSGNIAGDYHQGTFGQYDATAPAPRGPGQHAPLSTLSPPMAAASTSSPPASSSSGASSGSSSGSRVVGQSSGNRITVDQFSQAMAHALQQQQPPSLAASSQDQEDAGATLQTDQLQGTLEVQLTQLRSMGISDDARILRALQATQGNVQAALELIFGGSL